MPITGLDDLNAKLESLSDSEFKRMSKKVLQEVAEEIKDDMKGISPVSTVRNIHGRDAITTGKVMTSKFGSQYVEVGLKEILNGHGADYWTQIRGLWFQNFKTDEPNYGWFDNFRDSNKDKYTQELKKGLKEALDKKLGK